MRLACARLRANVHWILYSNERRRLAGRFNAAAVGTARAGHGLVIARRHLEVRSLSDTLLRHPDMWPTIRYPVDSLGTITKSGRGVVLTSIHSPTMWVAAATASAVLGYEIMWAVGDELLGAHREIPTDEGAAVLAGAGSQLIPVRESYRQMGQRLADHGIVGVLFDIPGRVSVKLLGKRTLVHPWFARLACQHGAAILPCLGCWEQNHLTLRFGTPVVADSSESLQSICQTVASSMEALWAPYPDHWSPYTKQLWPDEIGPYLWAFDDH